MSAIPDKKLGIIKITLKDPDGFSESIREAIANSSIIQNVISSLPFESEETVEVITETYEEVIHNKIKKWVKWSEYISLEIDLDNETIKVLEQ